MSELGKPSRAGRPLGPVHAGPVLLVAGLLFLAWLLGTVLLLVFAAVLLAVGLDGLAAPLAARTPLGRRWALLIVCLVLVGLIGLIGVLVVPRLLDQIGDLRALVIDFIGAAEDQLRALGLTSDLVEEVDPNGERVAGMAEDVLAQLANYGLTTLGALASVVVLVVTGVFLAATPDLYRRGTLLLLPPAGRAAVNDALSAVAHSLRWWFLSQLVSMAILGATVGLGLSLIGVDLWLSLAVLTALLTFIPYLGPIIAGIPILIVGFTEDVQTGLIVTAFYLFIQNLEGSVIVPLIQHKVVHLPPALSIIMQVLFGIVFGVAGFVLAAPMTVAGMVLVQKLYVERVLREER